MSSTKKNLNTRSSTEIYLVGADDFMRAICWTPYFMEVQIYRVLDNIMFQDNRSSILLENNGKSLSSKRTKHINIRYFFITNRVAQGNVPLVWCPTGDMIRDFMTKPLQGALFRKFRYQIMGVIPAQDPGPGKANPGKASQGMLNNNSKKFGPSSRAAPQECVGRSLKRTMDGRTYMRTTSVGLVATSEVAATATLFI